MEEAEDAAAATTPATCCPCQLCCIPGALLAAADEEEMNSGWQEPEERGRERSLLLDPQYNGSLQVATGQPAESLPTRGKAQIQQVRASCGVCGAQFGGARVS